MSEEKNVVRRGFPFISLLTLVLVLAKIWGKFQYSWWLVFSPIWIAGGLWIVFFVAIIAITALVAAFS